MAKEVPSTRRGVTRTTMKIHRFVAAVAFLSVPAFADFTFNASGTSAADGRVQDGQAVFTISGSTITVKLTNTDPNTIGGISQTLVGVAFTFDAGNVPGTLTLSTTATAAGAWNCTAGTVSCTSESPSTLGTDFG